MLLRKTLPRGFGVKTVANLREKITFPYQELSQEICDDIHYNRVHDYEKHLYYRYHRLKEAKKEYEGVNAVKDVKDVPT